MTKKTQVRAYPLRLPEKLKAFIETRAKENKRSLNSEVLILIELAIEAIEKQEQATHEPA